MFVCLWLMTNHFPISQFLNLVITQCIQAFLQAPQRRFPIPYQYKHKHKPLPSFKTTVTTSNNDNDSNNSNNWGLRRICVEPLVIFFFLFFLTLFTNRLRVWIEKRPTPQHQGCRISTVTITIIIATLKGNSSHDGGLGTSFLSFLFIYQLSTTAAVTIQDHITATPATAKATTIGFFFFVYSLSTTTTATTPTLTTKI